MPKNKSDSCKLWMLIYKCLQFTTLKYKQDISQKFIYMQALLYPPYCLHRDIYNLWWSRNPNCCVCDHLLPYICFSSMEMRIDFPWFRPVRSSLVALHLIFMGRTCTHRIYRKKTRFWKCICNEKVLSSASTKTFIQQFDRLLQFYL